MGGVRHVRERERERERGTLTHLEVPGKTEICVRRQKGEKKKSGAFAE